MIQVRTTNGEIKLFSNYHEVCHYINTTERRKALESGNIGWHFVRHRYETLASIYYRTPQLERDFFTSKEKEAVEKGVGLIEIMKGSTESFVQVLLTPNLDIEPLRKDWCQEYCKNHGLDICELVEIRQ